MREMQKKETKFVGGFKKLVCMQSKDRTKRKYEDTVHPLFLALNLSEVGVLLKFLPELLSKSL